MRAPNFELAVVHGDAPRRDNQCPVRSGNGSMLSLFLPVSRPQFTVSVSSLVRSRVAAGPASPASDLGRRPVSADERRACRVTARYLKACVFPRTALNFNRAAATAWLRWVSARREPPPAPCRRCCRPVRDVPLVTVLVFLVAPRSRRSDLESTSMLNFDHPLAAVLVLVASRRPAPPADRRAGVAGRGTAVSAVGLLPSLAPRVPSFPPVRPSPLINHRSLCTKWNSVCRATPRGGVVSIRRRAVRDRYSSLVKCASCLDKCYIVRPVSVFKLKSLWEWNFGLPSAARAARPPRQPLPRIYLYPLDRLCHSRSRLRSIPAVLRSTESRPGLRVDICAGDARRDERLRNLFHAKF
ncbi:hypothetical protein EVAR_21392_1 [Eumeta japonica]|uniref:Uncharacterized protein n=1 Tax=Eumeta variegata TaxID=151549 RepID=A0A4C1VHS7_EUMVA|nr:hypothetical protein EVAR_21392_1 [Eumeta japonica]